MILSRRSNGVHYHWYSDEAGRKCKVSTKTRSKPEARQLLRAVIQNGSEQKAMKSPAGGDVTITVMVPGLIVLEAREEGRIW